MEVITDKWRQVTTSCDWQTFLAFSNKPGKNQKGVFEKDYSNVSFQQKKQEKGEKG